ncbi:hypothetical protein F3Y22_tig00003041pilonHSYRG00118 [Hibiscus syriacus]|uniref:Putative plant transposon protein domain-containing protein n=1 Tax=Hibiscus syriacus TaxID=106335 RepID=A0A6A3CRQ7_HIBSY|nr:hypothetical protein F3Y22_tig00003041pilonHSYRG00118 [Hibiscus syriacus]
MVRSRPAPTDVSAGQQFEDDEEKARFQNFKNRKLFFVLSFIFTEETDGGFGPDVMDIMTLLKWKKFARHPGSMNASLDVVDRHAEFETEVDSHTYDEILEDLCFANTEWNGHQMSRYSVNRERLQPRAKLWNQFLKHKLMPTSHNTTVSFSHLLLLHSIIVSRPIDVGHIIVQQVNDYLVEENAFDEILPGLSGITRARLPMLLVIENPKSKDPVHEQSAGTTQSNFEAKLPALEEAVMQTQAQLHALHGDIRNFFGYVKNRDAVVESMFQEIIPHGQQNFLGFPDEILHSMPRHLQSPSKMNMILQLMNRLLISTDLTPLNIHLLSLSKKHLVLSLYPILRLHPVVIDAPRPQLDELCVITPVLPSPASHPLASALDEELLAPTNPHHHANIEKTLKRYSCTRTAGSAREMITVTACQSFYGTTATWTIRFMLKV